jgi:hypothetical protein
MEKREKREHKTAGVVDTESIAWGIHNNPVWMEKSLPP